MLGSQVSFGDHFTFEQFKEIAEFTLSSHDHNQYHKILEEKFHPSLLSFLKAKLENGELSLIPNSEGHSVQFIDAWNKMIRGECDKYDLDQITYAFSHHYVFSATYRLDPTVPPRHGTTSRLTMMEEFILLITNVTGGIIGPFDSHSRDYYCSVDGETYALRMTDWQIYFTRFDLKLLVDVDMVPISRPKIYERKIEFKTSELLIADWFRIKEFTSSIGSGKQTSKSVNCHDGKIDMTDKYLYEFNFISVSCGNSSPDIIKIDGALAFSYFNDEYGADNENYDPETYQPFVLPEGTDKIGRICCDLWWTTIIEKQNLIDIVSKSMTKDDAKKTVNTYIEEQGDDINHVTIKPGTYWLYFAGDHEEFKDDFKSDDLQIHPAIEPKFILSTKRLRLTETN